MVAMIYNNIGQSFHGIYAGHRRGGLMGADEPSFVWNHM